MCKMYLVNGSVLGQRLIGYEVYNSQTKGFEGLSETQLISKLKKGEHVYGFMLGKEEDKDVLVLDADNFNMVNLQMKSGVNNVTWLNEASQSDINTALIVVAVMNENGRRVYETVNARHARVNYDESKRRMLLELGVPVAGIKLVNNKIVVCDGVEDGTAGKVEEPKTADK